MQITAYASSSTLRSGETLQAKIDSAVARLDELWATQRATGNLSETPEEKILRDEIERLRDLRDQARHVGCIDSHDAAVAEAVAAGKAAAAGKPGLIARAVDQLVGAIDKRYREASASAKSATVQIATDEGAVAKAGSALAAAREKRAAAAAAHADSCTDEDWDAFQASESRVVRAVIEHTAAAKRAEVSRVAAKEASAVEAREHVALLAARVGEPIAAAHMARAIELGDGVASLYTEIRESIAAAKGNHEEACRVAASYGLPHPVASTSLDLDAAGIFGELTSTFLASRLERGLDPLLRVVRSKVPGGFDWGRRSLPALTHYDGFYDSLVVDGHFGAPQIARAAEALASRKAGSK